jgi:CNT family concentrative nucleoside transporter
MLKKTILLFSILALLLSVTSCSKKELTTEEKLTRYWNFSPQNESTASDSVHFLSLKNINNENIFHIYRGQDTNTGTWQVVDNKELVLFSPLQNMETDVDSIVQSFDKNGEVTFHYYKQESLIGTYSNNKFFPKKATLRFNLKEVTTEKLVVSAPSNDSQLFVFKYKPQVIESSISFYSVTRGLLGILALVFIAYLFSSNRKAISWSLVIKGLSIQIVLAIAVLYIPFVEAFFDALSSGFVRLISFTDDGVDFVFGQFGTGKIQGPLINFAFKILPTIIFFSALMSMLYYLGILQKIVYAFAWVMKKTLKLSGAESLAAAGNIFMGQTESPLLVKPYLDKMTKSELMCLMTGGMATIAGGVLAAYIGFLGGDDPAEQLFFAKHLLTASIMSAPAAVVAAKILVPETDKFNEDMSIPKDKIGTNILEAITNGTTDGLRLAVNVGAMLLVFTALMYMANFLLGDVIGHYTGLNDLIAENTAYSKFSFQFILGYTFSPIAGLMGVDNWNDMRLMGQLLGEKTILNEFYAYSTLGGMKSAGDFETRKAVVMSTYMLCGFANFASIGIQIGGIGALAPTRKGMLSKLGVKSLIGGTLACLFTAVVVGMLM